MLMPEKEAPVAKESLEWLPDNLIRRLIVVGSRSGLRFQDLDIILVTTHEKLGKGTDDYASLVQIHQRMGQLPPNTMILGIREETRKRRMVVTEDGTETEFVEAHPSVRNIWVGENVRLFTPDQAANTRHASHTALEWATVNGVVPEMVVRASNGLFYPATTNDVVKSPEK